MGSGVAGLDPSDHPIDGSYWALSGELLAGPDPGIGERDAQRRSVDALWGAGIRTIVDLTTPAETGGVRVLWEKRAPDDAGWAWIGMPILDGGVPSPAGMQLVLDTIDASLARERPVYVHCRGGLGRTGTVVGCWWIRHGLVQGEAVFDQLAHRRRGQSNSAFGSPETAPQFRMIRAWTAGR
jgi:hypothetical protein